MAKSITLFIPGLLDHLPDPVPRLPALETLLARADCRSNLPVGYECTLMHLFGLPQASDQDVPEGALSRYAQTGKKPEGVWLCAAPVHLFADQSRVYLNAIDEAVINESEAEQFIAELNKVYSEDGWEFVRHTSNRWYLRIPNEPSIRTTPLRDVDGKPIHDKLPQGDDALQWHRILNEIQMLLHASPVNQVRQEKGMIAVNGIWLWGVGTLPSVTKTSHWQMVWADEPFVRGLAALNDIEVSSQPVDISSCLQLSDRGEQLIVLPDIQISEPIAGLTKHEQEWFTPLLGALRKHEIHTLQIYDGKGRLWRMTRQHLWRIWRWRRPVSKMCLL